ncbi:ribosome-binding protein 1 isoform X3 [Hemicordylus capensis]|uniref:ribosome-binding protein 1 isoform X3 n=1 Tax=Hemicordylus capensis TaxID=884348 RepID=UPI0023030443|nr:ribosome-binding protein 1 isoform X3 [Hemicordylus capensis]
MCPGKTLRPFLIASAGKRDYFSSLAAANLLQETQAKIQGEKTQTLGVMVFGGFMLVSAIGIFLVSTFSMKETSYEEALEKQRKELEKTSQHKVEKKKKEKPAEKKGKAKKKEEKPNGRISDPDLCLDVSDASPESALVIEPIVSESPNMPLSTMPQEREKTTQSPKDKKKKEKKVAKAELTPGLAVSSPPTTVLKLQVSDMAPKEVSVITVPSGVAPLTSPVTEALGIQEHDGAYKKKATAKKKRESSELSSCCSVGRLPMPPSSSLSKVTADVESTLYLPYKTLISTISNMVFGEGETQQLIEILTEKAGGVQDTWHTATQKGDPIAVLKRQLEEKEKQLATEQENAIVAKAKLRELTKELAAEKAKTLIVENKLKEQLLTHEQEMAAVQVRMQASYQDHVTETQQLQGKIRILQEQLENGPNTQLARLQQENSILRDALNQATSQTESRQTAELAKLRQECSKRSKELTEMLETLQQVEEQKKTLEIKAVAYEEQIYQLQVSQKEKEAPLQKRLDEISEELCKSQASYKSLQTELGKTKEQQSSLAELTSKLLHSEMEVKNKMEELNSLQAELSEATSINVQFAERIKLTEALLKKSETREGEKHPNIQAANKTELSLMQLRLQESSTQVSALKKEAAELNDTVEQLKLKNNELREKNLEAIEALTSVEKSCEEKLLSSSKEKEALEQQLCVIQAQTKQMLLSLFPQVMLSDEQVYNEWLQQFREKASLLQQKSVKAESEMALSLREADEALSTLQAECSQYRTILAETERMLKDLQRSVEGEEQVWKAKVAASEEALQKSKDQIKCLEDDVEKFKIELQNTDKLKEYTSLLEAQVENHLATASSERQNYTKEVEVLRQLLCESQEHLDATKTEVLKQSQELAQLKKQLAQTEADLQNEHILREKLAEEFEMAQNSVCSLHIELEKLRLDGNVASSTTENILELQERLGKEKKLTKDLGCAATKLKELLKVTQEQLAKERETVQKLQEELQERGENEGSATEGTSV